MKRIRAFIKAHKKTAVLSVLSLFLCLGVLFSSLFFHFVPEAKYRLKNFFVTSFSSCRLKVCSPDTEPFTLQELQNDVRVSFDRSMMLISASHPLPQDAELSIGEYKDSGVYMDECVFGAYEALAKEIRDRFDNKLYIKSAYRSWQEQEQEYASSPELAAAPGSSEHQAGLALDLYVAYHAGYAFIECDEGLFAVTEGYRYGFILRYPYDAVEITGIAYEPWHLRYVGAPHAELITKNGLCLEQYLEKLELGAFYKYGSYLVTRQIPADGGDVLLPEGFKSATVSPDNCGAYVITVRM